MVYPKSSIYLYQQKQRDMTLTKTQNKELDNLKNYIESLERNMQKAQIDLEIAEDTKIKDDIKKCEKAIAFGEQEIKRMVTHQSISLKLEYNLVLDLIFDREYTLEMLNK